MRSSMHVHVLGCNSGHAMVSHDFGSLVAGLRALRPRAPKSDRARRADDLHRCAIQHCAGVVQVTGLRRDRRELHVRD
jgi:hypothetical protein